MSYRLAFGLGTLAGASVVAALVMLSTRRMLDEVEHWKALHERNHRTWPHTNGTSADTETIEWGKTHA